MPNKKRSGALVLMNNKMEPFSVEGASFMKAKSDMEHRDTMSGQNRFYRLCPFLHGKRFFGDSKAEVEECCKAFFGTSKAK